MNTVESIVGKMTVRAVFSCGFCSAACSVPKEVTFDVSNLSEVVEIAKMTRPGPYSVPMGWSSIGGKLLCPSCMKIEMDWVDTNRKLAHFVCKTDV